MTRYYLNGTIYLFISMQNINLVIGLVYFYFMYYIKLLKKTKNVKNGWKQRIRTKINK